MANTTQKGSISIHGKNPQVRCSCCPFVWFESKPDFGGYHFSQFLVEKVIRSRIWDSQYWKEQCFALTAVTLIDRAAEVHYVGGTFGGHNRPTEFVCLALKLLQLQPEKEIILEYLRAEDFKCATAPSSSCIGELTSTHTDTSERWQPSIYA
jgi:pre-mRNA-splicing factor 38A